MAQQTPLEIALRLIKLGRAPIPIPFQQKGPVLQDWQHLKVTAETAPDYFNGAPQNVGVLLGAPSNWLVDVDLDCPEALTAAPHLLPATGTFGRKSTPASHYLYESPGAKTKKYQVHRDTLVELRSTGTQTVFPGSVHPSGERVEYHDRRKVLRVDAADLDRLVGRVAAAALAGRHWGDGARHDSALALTGALLHAGWTAEDTKAFLAAVVAAGQDQEAQDRLRAVADTCARYGRGEAVTGWPRLSELLPAEVTTRLRQWLAISDTPDLLIGGKRFGGGESRQQHQEDQAEASEEWPEPQPLRREPPPAAPYPVEALGDVLGGMARRLAEVVQCPPALAGQAVLAAATLAAQAHADITIDGRTYPLSEFFVTVAGTGERKSAADREALAPHQFQQHRRLELHQEVMTQHKAEAAAYKRAADQALGAKEHETKEQKAEALRALGPEPVPPPSPIMISEEPTYEGLVKALHVGWPSMGLFSDEGGRFIGGHALRDENQLKTAAGLSKLWDGTPISRTRGVDGNILLYGRRVSMHLMVQPAVSAIFFGNSLFASQGLLSRCLVAHPASTIGSRPYMDTTLREAAAFKLYFARVLAMLEAPLPLREGAHNELEPRLLTLAPEAKAEWVRWHDHVEGLSGEGRELGSIQGFAAKAAEHTLRLAATLTLVEDIQAGAVPLRHLQAGIALLDHYLGEALRLFETAEVNPDLQLAERLLLWLQASAATAKAAKAANEGGGRSSFSSFSSSNPRVISLQRVYQYGPNPVRDKATALRVLSILADHGWVRPGPDNLWECRP